MVRLAVGEVTVLVRLLISLRIGMMLLFFFQLTLARG
jgi:hypothetical protein